MADVFLSYAREDKEAVGRVCSQLERVGLTVFWDQSLRDESNYHLKIKEEISQSRCVVVFWSDHSVRSNWVAGEAALAQRSEILLPVLLQEEPGIPPPFNVANTLSLVGWDDSNTSETWMMLLDVIEAKITPAFSRIRWEERRKRVQLKLDDANAVLGEAKQDCIKLGGAKSAAEQELERARAAHDQERHDLKAKISGLDGELKKESEKCDALVKDRDAAIAATRALGTEAVSLKATIGKLTDEKQQLEHGKLGLTADLSAAQGKSGSLESTLAETRTRIDEQSREIARLGDRNRQLEVSVATLNRTNQDLITFKNAIDRHMGNVATLRGHVGETQESIDALLEMSKIGWRQRIYHMIKSPAVLAVAVALGLLVGKAWAYDIRTLPEVLRRQIATLTEQLGTAKTELSTAKDELSKSIDKLAKEEAQTKDWAQKLRRSQHEKNGLLEEKRRLDERSVELEGRHKDERAKLEDEISKLKTELSKFSETQQYQVSSGWKCPRRTLPCTATGDSAGTGVEPAAASAYKEYLDAVESAKQSSLPSDVVLLEMLKTVAETHRHPEAMHSLAVRFAMSKDDVQAVHWYCEAAKAGNGDSLFNLAQRHLKGRGVDKDEALSADYMAEALCNGSAYAIAEERKGFVEWGGSFQDEVKKRLD